MVILKVTFSKPNSDMEVASICNIAGEAHSLTPLDSAEVEKHPNADKREPGHNHCPIMSVANVPCLCAHPHTGDRVKLPEVLEVAPSANN